MQTQPSIVFAPGNYSVPGPNQVSVAAPPSPATTLDSTADNKPPLRQISVTDTAILQRKWNDWMRARGCNPVESAEGIDTPMSNLRQQALNDNLTAAASLGFRLVFDPDKDGRSEPKQVLWQAAIQGSTCALMSYYIKPSFTRLIAPV